MRERDVFLPKIKYVLALNSKSLNGPINLILRHQVFQFPQKSPSLGGWQGHVGHYNRLINLSGGSAN